MYTAAIMKTELEASKGTRKLDMRIDNIQLVNVFTREIYPASIGIYNERIVAVGRVETEADQVIDGAGAYAVPGLIDSHIHIETTLLTPEALGEVIIPWGTTTLCVLFHAVPTISFDHNTTQYRPVYNLLHETSHQTVQGKCPFQKSNDWGSSRY